MALKKCRDCGNEVSTAARRCPQCGRPLPTAAPLLLVAGFGVAIASAVAWWGGGGGLDATRDRLMADNNNKVAEDAVEQYEIASKQGDKIQTCVSAGIVAAAYLQAKDQQSYNSWKGIQQGACGLAGISAAR